MYRNLKAGFTGQVKLQEGTWENSSQTNTVHTHHHESNIEIHEKVCHVVWPLTYCYSQCHGTGSVCHHHNSKKYNEESLQLLFQALEKRNSTAVKVAS